MRKDSQIVLILSIVMTAGIVGGAHYLYLQGLKTPPDLDAEHSKIVTGAGQAKRVATQPNNRTISGRTSVPIKCTKPDGTIFWTNATRCEDADLNNRLSFSDPVKPVPRVNIVSKRKNSSKKHSSQVSGSNKKSIKPIPRKMTVACSFPIGMAQKIETRSLRLKRDPAESIWKDSYCKWVCEAWVENCGNLDDYLWHVRICPWKPNLSKRSCGM